MPIAGVGVFCREVYGSTRKPFVGTQLGRARHLVCRERGKMGDKNGEGIKTT